ncbi:MAG: right-handed parallel beta-helix repeat-containing protein [Acidothermaceae bacterium]
MRRMKQTTAVGVLAGMASLALVVPGSAMAHTNESAGTVKPGKSIQQAIDRAKPHSVVTVSAGVYNENLLITKPITVRGIGHVVIEPGATIAQNLCTQDEDGSPETDAPNNVGICILGQFGTPPPDSDVAPVLEPVAHVTIENLRITGFSGQGLLAFGTDQLKVSNVEIDHSADVGLFSESGNKSVFLADRIHDNGSAGIRVSDSRDITISRTTSYDNREGMLILDSTGGNIIQTLLTANCAGLAIIDTSDGVTTGRISVRHNAIVANSRYCAAGEAPSESGVGVGLIGTSAVVVTANLISGNVASTDPTTGQAAQLSGAGLLLLDASGLTGGAAPTGNRITGNLVLRNAPQDVVTDGSGSGNTFAGNNCGQSTPASICS